MVADRALEQRIRLAEVIMALSLASDLGMGMSIEHSLRATL